MYLEGLELWTPALHSGGEKGQKLSQFLMASELINHASMINFPQPIKGQSLHSFWTGKPVEVLRVICLERAPQLFSYILFYVPLYLAAHL